jgi:hypothetical protein
MRRSAISVGDNILRVEGLLESVGTEDATMLVGGAAVADKASEDERDDELCGGPVGAVDRGS